MQIRFLILSFTFFAPRYDKMLSYTICNRIVIDNPCVLSILTENAAVTPTTESTVMVPTTKTPTTMATVAMESSEASPT